MVMWLEHFHAYTVSPANACHGHPTTPEEYALRGDETWRARSRCLKVNASTKIHAGLEDLFARLK